MQSPKQGGFFKESLAEETQQGVSYRTSFVRHTFTMSGLPHRKPEDDSAPFMRNMDNLVFSASPIPLGEEYGEHKDLNYIGVPYGSKARMALIWLSSQVNMPGRFPGNREIEIPIIKEWVSSLGLSVNGYSLSQLKEQILRLTKTHFSLAYQDEDNQEVKIFNPDGMIEGATYSRDDIEHYLNGHPEKMKWPASIVLTKQAYEGFLNHSVPIPTEALTNLSASSMAIDLLMFLSFRLPQVDPGAKELVDWSDLASLFGSGETPGKFKHRHIKAITAASAASGKGAVKVTDLGLLLHYRDPEQLKKAFYVSTPVEARLQDRKRRVKLQKEDAVNLNK
ncbi:replication protein RepA [Thalassospira sp. MCCC 1A02491]|uniref:replication protein RepA n=1 Tax=Thalassospira sp. MCCC 1A02491 TaxID=1769751 RepID=UPI000A7F63E4|nr:replication protein RepA [Thalassospira sp. MCCC 1A02491]